MSFPDSMSEETCFKSFMEVMEQDDNYPDDQFKFEENLPDTEEFFD